MWVTTFHFNGQLFYSLQSAYKKATMVSGAETGTYNGKLT